LSGRVGFRGGVRGDGVVDGEAEFYGVNGEGVSRLMSEHWTGYSTYYLEVTKLERSYPLLNFIF